MATFPDKEWNLADKDGNVGTWEKVGISVLMDIRRELRTLNRLLGCVNFVNIPHTLKAIEKNTKKRKYVRKVKPA